MDGIGPAFLLAQARSEEIVPSGLSTADWVQAGIIAAAALLVAVMLNRLVVRLVEAGSSSRFGVARLLGRLAALLTFAAGTVYALNTLGVRIGPLLGALGIVGLAVAFALQQILENFVASIIIQARSPFRVGDQVQSGDWEGTVQDINFRAVVLRTVDGTRVVIPSASVLDSPIQNLTAFDLRRTTVTVGIAYDTDLDTATGVIEVAVQRAEGVASHPAPEVLVEELAESSVNLAVRFWHEPSIAGMWTARDAVLRMTYRALGEAGIEIPFPQRTVSFADAPPPTVDASASREPR